MPGTGDQHVHGLGSHVSGVQDLVPGGNGVGGGGGRDAHRYGQAGAGGKSLLGLQLFLGWIYEP